MKIARKKLFILLFITISFSGLLFPAVSHASLFEWAADSVMNTLYMLVDFVGNMILSTSAWFLWFCGTVFNLSIVTFVIHMKTVIANMPAIYEVWRTVRDLANMFFIFILLYIAIATILDPDTGYKKMLKNVVVVALFINFSFFATGVLIDASNIVALQFYNGFAGGNCNGNTTGDGVGVVDKNANAINTAANQTDGCMSQKVVDQLRLGSIYNVSNTGQTTMETTILSSKQSLPGFVVKIVMGSILMIIVGGVFLMSAILIFHRFVELIMVLMFSPIAFAAMALPATEKYWKQWKDKLSTQLIFAPAYFMFLWVTMRIIQSDILKVGVPHMTMNWTDGFNGSAPVIFGLIANYIIIIMMLCYSLSFAKKLGAAGSDKVTDFGKTFRGFVGRNLVNKPLSFAARNTIGKGAYAMANSEKMKNIMASHPTLSKALYKPLDSLGSQGFGSKIGYDKSLENRKKSQIELTKRTGEAGLLVKDRVIRNKGESDADYAIRVTANNDSFKVRQKAAVDAGKERKKKITEVLGGYDESFTTKLSNKLGITAALRSNKEAYADVSKQINKDATEEENKEKRKKDLQDSIDSMHKLQVAMGHRIISVTPGVSSKVKDLAPEDEEDLVKDREITELADIEAKIASLDPKTNPADVATLSIEIGKKKRLEKNRKDFDALKNRMNNLQDRIDRDNEATKISTAAGKSTPPPSAPKTP